MSFLVNRDLRGHPIRYGSWSRGLGTRLASGVATRRLSTVGGSVLYGASDCDGDSGARFCERTCRRLRSQALLVSDMFPGFDRFYVLNNSWDGDPFHADLGVETREEALALTRGEVEPSTPIAATWQSGGRVPKDFIGTSVGFTRLISARVVQVLEGINATGWSTYPIQLTGRNGEHIPGFVGLAVRGRSGPRLPERSDALMKPSPVGNLRQVYRGYFFDESSWDGSDIFVTGATATTIVSQRVHDAFSEARLSNMLLGRVDLDERIWR